MLDLRTLDLRPERTEWLRVQRVGADSEVAWDAIRVVFEPRHEDTSWLARLLGRRPRTSLELEVALPDGKRSSHRWFAKWPSVPCALGPFFADGKPLARRRGWNVELVAIEPDAAWVDVRAALVDAPPDLGIDADFARLDPELVRFAGWWLENKPVRVAQESEPAPGGVVEVPLAFRPRRSEPVPTGAAQSWVYRGPRGIYVKTGMGCVRRIDTWHGPYVPAGDGYALDER